VREIEKLPFDVLDVPPADAATPFTVSAPVVGTALSGVSVNVDELWFVALSSAVTVFAPESVAPAVQL
jgi:hypothetical protein